MEEASPKADTAESTVEHGSLSQVCLHGQVEAEPQTRAYAGLTFLYAVLLPPYLFFPSENNLRLSEHWSKGSWSALGVRTQERLET